MNLRQRHGSPTRLVNLPAVMPLEARSHQCPPSDGAILQTDSSSQSSDGFRQGAQARLFCWGGFQLGWTLPCDPSSC